MELPQVCFCFDFPKTAHHQRKRICDCQLLYDKCGKLSLICLAPIGDWTANIRKNGSTMYAHEERRYMTPCEIYERKVTMEQLHAAMVSLPDKQAKRVYAYYFLGLTVTAIAKSEGVSATSVNESVQRGLRNMETFLKNRL